MLFTKITFFLMYLGLFRPMSWMRICAHIGTVLTSLFYGGMFLAQIIIRTPRPGETLASRLQTTSAASESLALSVPQSAVGLAIDLYILILPIIAVSQLQLPLRRKIGTSLIFATGITSEALITATTGSLADYIQRLRVLVAQHLLQRGTK
jgi:hypothetical protein